ncbi:hypothetical protein [Nocardia lijiangensis]|uniref:hypothetical protein n=1 Tax=Nocardia lijiangensis TaxID=299618 RepID=UPI000B2224A7|nr:hypothetical protein [Nocardia lijiangensis]
MITMLDSAAFGSVDIASAHPLTTAARTAVDLAGSGWVEIVKELGSEGYGPARCRTR